MAVDGKYGRVTLEHGDIGEDEPVVVFRAKDLLLPKVLAYYHLFCMKAGSPKRHLDLIFAARERVMAWQQENQPKLPTSEGARAWMPSDGSLLPVAQNDWRAAAGPQTSGSAPPWLPLYVHVGPDPVTTEWTKVTATTLDGSPLYTFSGDTPGGRPWGVCSDWQHYTGAVADHVLAREQTAAAPLEVFGLYRISRFEGGNVTLSLQGERSHTFNRDNARLLGAALQQAATTPADRPHVCSPIGYCPPADEVKPATDTKANRMALAVATDDSMKEALQLVLDQLTWVEIASRADAHRQLDAVLDVFARAFGHKHVGEPYMGGG